MSPSSVGLIIYEIVFDVKSEKATGNRRFFG